MASGRHGLMLVGASYRIFKWFAGLGISDIRLPIACCCEASLPLSQILLKQTADCFSKMVS